MTPADRESLAFGIGLSLGFLPAVWLIGYLWHLGPDPRPVVWWFIPYYLTVTIAGLVSWILIGLLISVCADSLLSNFGEDDEDQELD